MLIKFDADPNVDAGSTESDSGTERSVSESSSSSSFSSSTSPAQPKAPATKEVIAERTKRPKPLLPFYEDYHMVHDSDADSDGSSRGKLSRRPSPTPTSGSEDERKKDRTPSADVNLVKGVLELINAAKSASPGRSASSEKAPRVKAPKKNGKHAEKKTATSKVGDGRGGKYTVLKSPLPAKTKKSLESIARQLQVLQGKIDELAKHA